MKNALMWVLSAVLFLAGAAGFGGQDSGSLFDEADRFLKKYVDQGLIDYAAIRDDPAMLEHLVAGLATADPLRLPDDAARQAFWINAYNLLVIHSVVSAYPVRSPMDVDGFFDRRKHQVAGQELTLNEIEHEQLLKPYGDPRFHFVLVCAAVGCPQLIAAAYRGETLEAQLQERARATLNSDAYVRVDATAKKVFLVEIFRWYEGDFTTGGKTLLDYVNQYRDQPIPGDYLVEFPTYDWTLNAQAGGMPR